ncbi:MAG TPA: MBL fold metallo-hydrolase, partial [Salinimicrobium sp.]|nr:MBL fold metallo-hydrolase [Salinimicrobium sp.]
MKIERFYDINLAHASYAILSGEEIALIDPARDPQPYYEFAVKNHAKIVAVIETHPHADFVSSHLEIHQKTDASIYVSELLGAEYPHKSFDDGKEIKIGEITLKAINSPGHSPDSISILLYDEQGKEHAIFTGDTLFIGDVGRPDLREKAGKTTAKREALAKQMYESIKNKFRDLKDETLVYPAHGAGSLCGKNLSTDAFSSIGKERENNWAFKEQTEEEFVQQLLEDQPFVPKYFGFDVDLNKKGANPFENSVHGVKRLTEVADIKKAERPVVDVRNEAEFKNGHLPNSINIMLTEKGKFETWLGAIIDPSEKFYLVASSEEQLEKAISRAAKIGYEKQISGALALKEEELLEKSDQLDIERFSNDPDAFSIVDIRNSGEIKQGKYFKNAISIPLPELRENIHKIPTDKPIVVHCAAGY